MMNKQELKQIRISCEIQNNIWPYVIAQEEYIKQLEQAQDICHGTVVETLDGELVPGTIYDGTDGACPGWWRGNDAACIKAIEKLDRS